MSSLHYQCGPVAVLSVPSRNVKKRIGSSVRTRSGFPLLEKAFIDSGCVADNDPRLEEGEEPFLEK
jgi:hypothetical protein